MGEAALRLFLANTEGIIYARENDGQRRDDGSHLTGDAPIFVEKMQAKKLIEKYR